MKHVWLIGLSAVASMAMGGCGSSEVGSIERMPTASEHERDINALVVDEQTETRTTGRLHTMNGDLTFTSVYAGEEGFSVKIVVNGKTFDGTLDGEITIMDGYEAVLSLTDRALLRTFADALAVRFGTTMLRRDSSMYGWAVHLSNAPEGYVHVKVDTTPAPEVAALTGTPVTDAGPMPAPWKSGTSTPVFGNEGKTCTKKGSVVMAAYANASGVKYVERVVVGVNWGKLSNGSSYDCMGKCGAACGMGGGYTKDCMDHDACSYRYRASGGSSDSNCGDEYKAASDDIFNSCSTY
jgi:hypothetical protein